jgi:hypothetical protein
MEPTEQLSTILPTLTAMVDRIEPAQPSHPTPCSRCSVHDVLDHMIVGGSSVAYQLRGQEAPKIKTPPVYGWVPAAEFRQAMDDLLAAVNSQGAMERTITGPFREIALANLGMQPGAVARRVNEVTVTPHRLQTRVRSGGRRASEPCQRMATRCHANTVSQRLLRPTGG